MKNLNNGEEKKMNSVEENTSQEEVAVAATVAASNLEEGGEEVVDLEAEAKEEVDSWDSEDDWTVDDLEKLLELHNQDIPIEHIIDTSKFVLGAETHIASYFTMTHTGTLLHLPFITFNVEGKPFPYYLGGLSVTPEAKEWESFVVGQNELLEKEYSGNKVVIYFDNASIPEPMASNALQIMLEMPMLENNFSGLTTKFETDLLKVVRYQALALAESLEGGKYVSEADSKYLDDAAEEVGVILGAESEILSSKLEEFSKASATIPKASESPSKCIGCSDKEYLCFCSKFKKELDKL